MTDSAEKDAKQTISHPGAKVAEAVLSPGYTPSVRHAPELIALLADQESDPDDTIAAAVERALARLGEALVPVVEREFGQASGRAKVHVIRAVGRLDCSESTVEFLIRALEQEELRVRRAAVRALGKTRGKVAKRAEQALLEAWKKSGNGIATTEERALAEALGKLGSQEALALIDGIESEGEELRRVVTQSKMRIERTAQREVGGEIAADAATRKPVPIAFGARQGLEEILEIELSSEWRAHGRITRGDGEVRAMLGGPLSVAQRPRTALSFSFPLSKRRLDPERIEQDVAEVIAGDEARQILTTFTRGVIRYRLSFKQGGHKRSLVLRIAHAVSNRAPELVNDPTQSLWEVIVDEDGRSLSVSLVPRGLADERFSYRVRDVAAASHPTIAAALARVAEVGQNDVVWDPFVGSGTELVECAKVGAPAALFGSDLDARALTAAEANLNAAKVKAELVRANALSFAPPQVSLIVTNPPMGLRVERTKELSDMLSRFIAHAANVLPVGGRLVWLSPFSARTRPVAISHGFTVELGREVDMGGFSATLELLRKKRR